MMTDTMRAWAVIDTGALIHNYELAKKLTDANVKRGDVAILYGRGGMPMEQVAELADSINCEPLSLPTNRVAKVYI